MRIITELQWYEFDDPNNDGGLDNECRISNDPETSTKKANQTRTRQLRSSTLSSIRQLKTCNITQYMCSTSSTTTSPLSNQTNTNKTTSSSQLSTNGIIIEAMEVLYEYELYYNQHIDIDKTIIPYIEESIIVNLAFQMGIQQQCRKQNRRRQLQQRQIIVENTNDTTSTASSSPQFIGIQTKPYDRINPKYTTCQYPVSNISNRESSTVCVPMLGGVTVFVQHTVPPLVASSLLDTINTNTTFVSSFSDAEDENIRSIVTSYLQNAMDHDVFVVPSSIEKLVYVGNSSIATSGGEGSGNIPTGGNSSSSAFSSDTIKTGWLVVLIGFLLCLAVLVGCCCFFFCCCCRKQRKRRQRRQTADPSNDMNSRNTTARSVVDASINDVGTAKSRTPLDGKQCLASLDSLALKDGVEVETIIFDDTEHDSEIPTDSDSSGFDDDAIPTTMKITGFSNQNILTSRDEPKASNQEVLVTEDVIDDSIHNDDTSEELVGQKVVDFMEENERGVENEEVDAEDAVDGESLIETLSEEMDLLDRLALQGRPPPYPTTSTSRNGNPNNDLLLIAPTRSLSPTTVSATSQGTSTYMGARNIVGSPTTCSQVTMPAGNLRYQSNRVPSATAATNATTRSGIGLMKKVMMVPQHQHRFNSTNSAPRSTIRTAYTPDSFDEEILGITSDDSRDNINKTNNSAKATTSVPVVDHMNAHEERQQYQQRHYPPPHSSITYPDVLDEHMSYTFNENDEDDDLFSFQSDHNNNNTTTATSNAVQRHLQMS